MVRWRFRNIVGVALTAVALIVSAPTQASAAAATGKQEPRAAVEMVDINTASVEALMSVPGLGEVVAQRIVEFREKNGPYKSLDDLLKIQGIGEKSLAKMRQRLTVGKGKK